MPRGVYVRKKKFPGRNLRQVKMAYQDWRHLNQPKEERRQHKQLIEFVLTSLQSNLYILKDLLNG